MIGIKQTCWYCLIILYLVLKPLHARFLLDTRDIVNGSSTQSSLTLKDFPPMSFLPAISDTLHNIFRQKIRGGGPPRLHSVDCSLALERGNVSMFHTPLLIQTPYKRTMEGYSCKTPHGEIGTCIPIKQCKSMIEYLEHVTSVTQDIAKMLTEYQCDLGLNDIMVCCPNGPIIILDERRNLFNHNLLNHRNINLLPEICGGLPRGNRIIGGSKTALFEFPWMALLAYETENGFDFRCGGTVINNRYILTAAHCVAHLTNLRLDSVRCGEYNISSVIDCETDLHYGFFRNCASPVQDMDIEEVIPHPNFDLSRFSDDIALIRLAAPLNFNVESVKPICLPVDSSPENSNLTSRLLIVTGWGVTETGPRSLDLLKADLRVTSQKYCQKAYAHTGIKLTNKQFCAGGHNRRDSCKGDSGGPLQGIEPFGDDDRFVQYGIVSLGPKVCGIDGFPGIYTRTDSYIEWILDNLKP